MPTTVFATSGDSVVEKSVASFIGGASWSSTVRGSATMAGSSQDSTLTNYDFGVWNDRTGRGFSAAWKLNRSFFPFNLSSLSGTVASADLKIFSDNLGDTGTNSSTVYAVTATALADSTDDYGNVFSSGTTLGTLYGSTTISTTLGYHTITLNSDAITAINAAIGSGTITIGLMGYYDYNNTDPSTNAQKIAIYYSEASGGGGTGADPKLELTFASVGYGHDVVGVASANIGKVNGVATANIGKINTVD
jgi:hypothetical protein